MTRALGFTLSTILLITLAHADPPTGWRFDGSGVYPDADPPIAWSTDKNVVWKIALPTWSNASPVMAGDRVSFTGKVIAGADYQVYQS